jgi:hypothetical protein
MVMNLMTFSLVVLKVSKAAQYCFDDSPGQISVTLAVPTNYRYWSLRWQPWQAITYVKPGGSGTASASGCSTTGMFLIKRQNYEKPQQFHSPFEFATETHVTCLPGIPFCSFAVQAHLQHGASGESLYVTGVLHCNCVANYTEVGDEVWKDSEANAKYITPIRGIILFENEQSYN